MDVHGITTNYLHTYLFIFGLQVVLFIFYFLNIFIDYVITVVPFPPPTPLHPAHPLPPTFPPIVHIHKFFGFYISYTILTLPLSIFYLPFMLLILCTFPPSLPLPC